MRKLEKQSTTLAPVVWHVHASACFDWLLLSLICFAAAGEGAGVPSKSQARW
jgi:hypothetical protein